MEMFLRRSHRGLHSYCLPTSQVHQRTAATLRVMCPGSKGQSGSPTLKKPTQQDGLKQEPITARVGDHLTTRMPLGKINAYVITNRIYKYLKITDKMTSLTAGCMLLHHLTLIHRTTYRCMVTPIASPRTVMGVEHVDWLNPGSGDAYAKSLAWRHKPLSKLGFGGGGGTAKHSGIYLERDRT